MSQFEKLSLMVSFLLFLVILAQLRTLRKQIKGTHEHDLAKDAMDIYTSTLTLHSEADWIPFPSETAEIERLLSTMDTDRHKQRKLAEYLGHFEILATGARCGLFDKTMIDRLTGDRLRMIVKNYKPWIEKRRAKSGDPNLYIEMEQLAAEFDRTR